MKKQFTFSLYLGSLLVVSASHAADLKQSKFTQVVNDVRVISMANNLERPAAVNDIFNMPDLVRTGVASRAELVAADDTITRVGANTIFSFDPANRTIDLQQGSLLFHSPKGKGGGTIHTGSATASVLGTTLIVTTTRDGGFKVIDLEGHVAIQFLNGVQEHLAPGQMTFVLHDGHPAPIITIRLDKLTNNSKLVQGFAAPLPSMPLIQQQIADQVKLIQSGLAQDTGLLVGDVATRDTVQVVRIDPNTLQGNQKSDEPPTTTESTPPPPTAVTLNTPTLPSQYIFNSSETFGSFTFPAPGFLAPSSLPNITISTPTIDLTPYKSATSFGFLVPNGTLTTTNSVVFSGLSSTATLDLFAQQFSFASGSTLEADVGTFNLEPQTATTLSNVAILNKAASGGIIIFSPAAFSLTKGSSVNAAGMAELFSDSTLTLNKATVQGSSVDLFGSTGVNIAGGSTVMVTGGNLNIADGGGINLSASTLNAIAGPPVGDSVSGDVSIAATGDAVNISNGASITAANQLSLASDTGVSIADSSLTSGTATYISSGGAVSVTGSPTTTGYTTTFTGNTSITSGTSLSVNGATFNADPNSGTVTLSALSGSTTLQNASVTAGTLTLDSNILSDSGSITLNNASITAGTLSLMSGINTGSINIQNSAITTTTPLALTAGATSGTVTIGNSSAQSDSTTLSGATGVSIANGSNVGSTSGNLDISTTGGVINISASTLNAIAGPPIGDSSSGVVDIEATGGAANISNGASITSASQLRIASDTGISISGASSLTSSGEIFIEGDPSGTSAPVSVTGNSTLISGTESNLVIQAGTALTVNGATLNADPVYGEVFMSSDTDSITVQNASITAGAVSMHDFGTSGSITVQNTSLTTPMVTMIAGSNSGSITVQNSTINAPTVNMMAPSAATTDSITIGPNTSITTTNLTLNSGDGILLDGTGGGFHGSGALSLIAPSSGSTPNTSVSVSNADLSSFASVSMAAYTVYLTGVTFPSTGPVNLQSFFGSPQFPATRPAASPGYVNFIGNNYGYISGTKTPINGSTLPSMTNIQITGGG